MSSMAVAEPMTAEEHLARPYDPRERGAELLHEPAVWSACPSARSSRKRHVAP
jgi:hypothetical protein